MRHKKITALLLCLTILFAFTACTETEKNIIGVEQPVVQKNASEITLDVFAPEEISTAALNLADAFRAVAPNVSIRLTMDDPVMLAEKVYSGYSCDVLIDFTAVMDQIDGKVEGEGNPGGYDCIYSDTRRDVFIGPADKELFKDEFKVDAYIYSAALTRSCKFSDEAKQFVEFLVSDEARAVYTQCDCSPIE